jgi:hypothetical protein
MGIFDLSGFNLLDYYMGIRRPDPLVPTMRKLVEAYAWVDARGLKL